MCVCFVRVRVCVYAAVCVAVYCASVCIRGSAHSSCLAVLGFCGSVDA